MVINKIEWAKNLLPGDIVRCNYDSTNPFIAKVEYILTESQSQSGISVKLEGIKYPLDMFWIFPA